MEVLNRYESHLLNTGVQALAFVKEVGAGNVGVLLDAYHMNIEEADPVGVVLDVGERLFLFHVADSNRQAAGRGHTDFPALMRALRRVGFSGDMIFECTAAGPDPFTPVKEGDWLAEVRRYATESLQLIRTYIEFVPSDTYSAV
jgi:sugar phosphate isomerase/epimerase